MVKEEQLRKVVVGLRDGGRVLGFAKEDWMTGGARVKIISRQGKEQAFSTSDIKAIFFVKEFKGDAEYTEVKFLRKETPPLWLWVRLRFCDGEIMEGKVKNDMELLASPGFYLWPSDEESNNERVFVFKTAVDDFFVIGTH